MKVFNVLCVEEFELVEYYVSEDCMMDVVSGMTKEFREESNYTVNYKEVRIEDSNFYIGYDVAKQVEIEKRTNSTGIVLSNGDIVYSRYIIVQKDDSGYIKITGEEKDFDKVKPFVGQTK